MSPSGKLARSRRGSRESKKPVEGEEGLLRKEDLTPKDQRPEDPKRQVKKEKKPVGEEDVGWGGGVIVEWLCDLASPPEASLPFPAREALPGWGVASCSEGGEGVK
jgi:hypothetical protein